MLEQQPASTTCSSNSDDGSQDEEGTSSHDRDEGDRIHDREKDRIHDRDEGQDSQVMDDSVEGHKGERAQKREAPVTRRQGRAREGGKIPET